MSGTDRLLAFISNSQIGSRILVIAYNRKRYILVEPRRFTLDKEKAYTMTRTSLFCVTRTVIAI